MFLRSVYRLKFPKIINTTLQFLRRRWTRSKDQIFLCELSVCNLDLLVASCHITTLNCVARVASCNVLIIRQHLKILLCAELTIDDDDDDA